MPKKIRPIVWLLILIAVVALIVATKPQPSDTAPKEASDRNSSPSAISQVDESRTDKTARTSDKGSVERRLLAILQIDDVDDRNYEIELLLKELGPEHLATIRAAFESQLDDSLYMREWEHFLKWWVDFAPEDALFYGASDFDGDIWDAKHLAATAAAEYWLTVDPVAAGAQFSKLPAGQIRDNIMAGFGQEYAISDLEGAIAWADADPSPEFRSAALFGVAYGALRSGMHDNFDPEITTRTANWLREHADQPYAAKALSVWVEQVVREDSEQAAEWVNWVVDLPEGDARNAAVQSFFQNASHTSPEALDGWLDQVEDGPALDFATAGYLRNASQQPLDSAGLDYLDRLSRSIQNEELREQSQQRILNLRASVTERP